MRFCDLAVRASLLAFVSNMPLIVVAVFGSPVLLLCCIWPPSVS